MTNKVHKCGVLYHGYITTLPNWAHVCIGAGDAMGRLTKTLDVAREVGASALYFGCGGYCPSRNEFGSERSFNLIPQVIDARESFKKAFSVDVASRKLFLHGRDLSLHIETSKEYYTTEQEFVSAGKFFLSHGITFVYLVSSPEHLRVPYFAHKARKHGFPQFCFIPSDTEMGEGEEPIIFEPSFLPVVKEAREQAIVVRNTLITKLRAGAGH